MDRKIICQKEFKALKPTKLELSRAVLLTRQQLAEYLKVNVRTIDNYRKLHGLPFLKVGNSVRFRIIDVEKWLFFQKFRKWGEKESETMERCSPILGIPQGGASHDKYFV